MRRCTMVIRATTLQNDEDGHGCDVCDSVGETSAGRTDVGAAKVRWDDHGSVLFFTSTVVPDFTYRKSRTLIRPLP